MLRCKRQRHIGRRHAASMRRMRMTASLAAPKRNNDASSSGNSGATDQSAENAMALAGVWHGSSVRNLRRIYGGNVRRCRKDSDIVMPGWRIC